jgi:hypothetical protein
VDLIADSFLVFGRASLGAAVGLAIGWPTQGQRHSRWVVGWVLAGFAVGVALMWPTWQAIVAAAMLLVPTALGAFFGMVFAASTLGTREDWYIRAWGFAGFLVTFHACAIGAMALVDAIRE